MNRFLDFQQKGTKRASSLDRVCPAEHILLSATGRAIAVPCHSYPGTPFIPGITFVLLKPLLPVTVQYVMSFTALKMKPEVAVFNMLDSCYNVFVA